MEFHLFYCDIRQVENLLFITPWAVEQFHSYLRVKPKMVILLIPI